MDESTLVKYLKDLYTSFISFIKKGTPDSKNNINKNILLTLYAAKQLNVTDLTKISIETNENPEDFEVFLKAINRLYEYDNIYETFYRYIINNTIEKELINIKSKKKSENIYIQTLLKLIQDSKQKAGSSTEKILKEIALLKELDVNINKFKESIFILNDIEDLKDYNLQSLDGTNNYIIKDFTDYLELNKIKLLDYYKKYVELFKKDIVSLNKTRGIEKTLKKYNLPTFYIDYIKNIEGVNEIQDDNIKTKYTEAINYIEKYSTPEKKEEIEADSRLQQQVKLKLASFYKLLNTNNGDWKKDKDKDLSFSDNIISVQSKYVDLLGEIDYTKVEIKKDYDELYRLYESLKTISLKIEKKQKIKEAELVLIKNFDLTIQKLQGDKLYDLDNNYKKEVDKIEDLYTILKGSKLSDEKINEVSADEKNIIKENVVYFDNYSEMFTRILYYIVLACIVILFSVVLLSIVSLFSLIYEILNYIMTTMVNSKITKELSIDYLSKSIIQCTKTDLAKDTLYIITEQKQNLILFNISSYAVYLLLFYIIYYFLMRLYAMIQKKDFKGSPLDIDKSQAFIPIIVIVIGYSIIHFILYKKLFKNYVYIPYKISDNYEKKVDEKIADYILIKDDGGITLVDDNFFRIIYDLTLIDELNKIFSNGIESKNKDNCLEQKIIIYDIYMYLREYVVFDSVMKQKFKEYCTSKEEDKPKYENKETKMTFVSLLNNSEVKMIKKYHEELAFFNKIADDKLEFYNNLNNSINNKIKNINIEIITHNKTIIPFFVTIFYILLVLLLNIFVFYLVLTIILKDDGGNNQFNYYFVKAAYTIKSQLYDRILNYIFNIK